MYTSRWRQVKMSSLSMKYFFSELLHRIAHLNVCAIWRFDFCIQNYVIRALLPIQVWYKKSSKQKELTSTVL